MNTKSLLFIGSAVLLLAGCASERGGTADTYDTLTGPGTIRSSEVVTNADGTVSPYGESQATRNASPSFRPGMNPRDPRDPQFIQRSQEQQSPTGPP